jgi:rod shape-determining protein MreD
MRSLRFIVGLLAAVLLHVIVVRLFAEVSPAVDLFLVLALFNALGGRLGAGLFGGLVAGLTADVLTGGLYGLHGFANTIAGYGTAFASRRLVIQKATGVMLLFSLAAAVQQAIIAGLKLLLLPEAALPTPSWIAARVVVVGIVGFLGFAVKGRYASGVESWRRNRTARLR